MNESHFEQWWERTWSEREDELRRAFGESHPPGSAEGYVITFSWDDPERIIPGACALVFPPYPGDRPQAGERRDDWLYVTHGLAQPAGPEEVAARLQAGESHSGYGWEFGLVVAEPAPWVPNLLYELLTYTREGKRLGPGHRYRLVYRAEDGTLQPSRILTAERDQQPGGATAALIFWPFLLRQSHFVTSTGDFGILIGTLVTGEELELARKTTSSHLLLLLCNAGIAQRSDPLRGTVTHDLRWAREWERVAPLSYETVLEELNAGRGKWQIRQQ
jgi:hypothetical protein